MSYQVYVSLQNEDCIRRLAFDRNSGALEKKAEYEAKGGPAPMCLSPDGRVIHVGFRGDRPENSPGSNGGVLPEHGLGSFAIDGCGDLHPIGRVHNEGEPCFVRTDHSGHFLLSAHPQVGRVATHGIDASGAVAGPAIEWIATHCGAHSVQIDSSNRFAFVPHIGEGNGGLKRLGSSAANAIFQFRFDDKTGRLTPNNPPRTGPGQDLQWGPRHSCWHPAQPWLYVVNEQGNSISRYTMDGERGTLSLNETVDTLPPQGHPGKTSTADIQMHPSGRFLYAPNRGHDTITSYRVDQVSGRLSHPVWTRADAHPRAFMLDPSGHFLLCAGMTAGRLTAYGIDQAEGTLTELQSVHCGRVPMWVLITELPGA